MNKEAALIWSCTNGHAEIVKLLLAGGADKEIRITPTYDDYMPIGSTAEDVLKRRYPDIAKENLKLFRSHK